jgi:membrane protein implicated in regulation of membrane protease activity
MDHNVNPSHGARESFLGLMLALLVGGGFLLFLILVSGGFFFYVGCIAAVITALGFLHYAVWGALMSQSVAAERQAEEERARHEVNGDAVRDRYGIRRF